MLPLFPLPNVVLFPDAYLPLHVFEHRYRTMVRDVLEGSGTIGMVLLRSGWQTASATTPPVYATGCAGRIVHHEALDDGRYNIVLQGTQKFSIRQEHLTRPYREADVDWLEDAPDPGQVPALHSLRRRLDALLLPAVARGDARVPADMSDGALVNAVSQSLDIDVLEKLALLEKKDVVTRAVVLVDRIERLIIEQGPADGPLH